MHQADILGHFSVVPLSPSLAIIAITHNVTPQWHAVTMSKLSTMYVNLRWYPIIPPKIGCIPFTKIEIPSFSSQSDSAGLPSLIQPIKATLIGE